MPLDYHVKRELKTKDFRKAKRKGLEICKWSKGYLCVSGAIETMDAAIPSIVRACNPFSRKMAKFKRTIVGNYGEEILIIEGLQGPPRHSMFNLWPFESQYPRMQENYHFQLMHPTCWNALLAAVTDELSKVGYSLRTEYGNKVNFNPGEYNVRSQDAEVGVMTFESRTEPISQTMNTSRATGRELFQQSIPYAKSLGV